MKLNNNAIIFFIFVFSFVFFNFANDVFASEINENIVQEIIQKFKGNTGSWYNKLTSIAQNIFALVIFFEFLWFGTKAVVQRMPGQELLSNLVMIILSATVFLAIINNYQDWTDAIVHGLSNTAVDMIGGRFRADNPFQIGLDMYDKIHVIAVDADWDVKIPLWFCSLLIVIIFALITSRVIVIHCENLVGLLACILIVPFGASPMFREYAISSIRYAVSVGFKLFTMTLICGVGFTLLDYVDFGNQGELKDCLILIASSMVLLAITFTLPDTIASLISSAHGSAGGMLQAYNTVANTVTAGAATAGAVMGMGKSGISGMIKGGLQGIRARGLARETAGSSWQGMSAGAKAWDTARAWNVGRQQASMNHSQIHRELKINIMQLRQLRQQNQL